MRTSLLTGFTLFQVGEFAFILAAVGVSYGVLADEPYQYFLAVSVLTMALTPFLMQASDKLSLAMLSKSRYKHVKMDGANEEMQEVAAELKDHLIIIGYGLNGRHMADIARNAGIPYAIIDINTDSLDRLGVNWKLDLNSSGSDFIEFNPFSSDTSTSDTFSTIIQNTSGRLFTQVNLLSSEGKAKVLARPSVLTLDNMEAVLDNSQTFYVEVASTEDAQLFPVTYGSVLKVTPRIVEEVTGRKIHLSVNIQDGARGDTRENVKELPTIKNSTISTQAVIDENESLLIGGYYYESNNQSVSKVPVLGDIPLVGAMFRSKSDTYVKTVRLFLITPRIVNLM